MDNPLPVSNELTTARFIRGGTPGNRGRLAMSAASRLDHLRLPSECRLHCYALAVSAVGGAGAPAKVLVSAHASIP
jgi:hypothetical protein